MSKVKYKVKFEEAKPNIIVRLFIVYIMFIKSLLEKSRSFIKSRILGYLLLLVFFLTSLSTLFYGYTILQLSQVKPIPQTIVDQIVEEHRINPDIDSRLIIPKLGLDLLVQTGSEEVLQEGMWHRFPERGDPENGGNIILSGHRFNIGRNPDQTVRSSPLYNIHKLQAGDSILYIWEGEVYQYNVYDIFNVKPNQVEIEAPTDEHYITLYTCTLKGSADGRVVLRAKPIDL